MGTANEAIPFYEPGQRITAHCEAGVTGKRFVDISDPAQSGPELSSTAEGGNIVVSPASAGGLVLGVASYDAATGKKVAVIIGGVVPVVADGNVTAGQQIEVGTAGKAKTRTTGKAVGRALESASSGADVPVLLYQGVGVELDTTA